MFTVRITYISKYMITDVCASLKIKNLSKNLYKSNRMHWQCTLIMLDVKPSTVFSYLAIYAKIAFRRIKYY